MEEGLILNYCECCGRIVGKEPTPKFNYDPIEAAYLGPGIPLYFAFFRYIIFLLLIYLFGFSIHTTIININVSIIPSRGQTAMRNVEIKHFGTEYQFLTLLTQQVQWKFKFISSWFSSWPQCSWTFISGGQWITWNCT